MGNHVAAACLGPPLCKGRCRAAAVGLWTCRYCPGMGYSTNFTTPQSAFADSSPYTGEPFGWAAVCLAPPLCKGRCRAAAVGLGTCRYCPRTGYSTNFTTPQSAFADSSPYTGEPFGWAAVCLAPPLCKGRCRAAAVGLFACCFCPRTGGGGNLPTPQSASADSSPYTGEPGEVASFTRRSIYSQTPAKLPVTSLLGMRTTCNPYCSRYSVRCRSLSGPVST